MKPQSPESTNSKVIWPVDLVEYSAGQLIIREGESADCAYIIQQGEVEIFKCSPDRREIPIARLGPQEIFGEMCLFEESPVRSASVRVLSDYAQVMLLSKVNFQRQLEATPDGLRAIMQILVKRLQKANQHICLLS